MSTEKQTTEFKAAIEEIVGTEIDRDDIVTSRDTLENFITAHGSPGYIDYDYSFDVHAWEVLPKKLNGCTSLYVAEFNEFTLSYAV